MFQMNCSNCSELIKSPLLVEVQVIECPQCEEIVGVKNVVVSTKEFSISLRSSLKKLLIAARNKFRLNKSHIIDVQTSYEVDKRLAKILRRDDFRLDMSYDLYVQINFDSNKRLAKLLKGIVVVYGYTARQDLDFSTISDNMIVNGSNFMVSNQFIMVSKNTNLKGLEKCKNDCRKCNLCKSKSNKVIHVTKH